MKTKSVDTITSNEEHVRLKIFDGELPAEDAVKELLALEKSQHARTRADYLRILNELCDVSIELRRVKRELAECKAEAPALDRAMPTLGQPQPVRE